MIKISKAGGMGALGEPGLYLKTCRVWQTLECRNNEDGWTAQKRGVMGQLGPHWNLCPPHIS